MGGILFQKLAVRLKRNGEERGEPPIVNSNKVWDKCSEDGGRAMPGNVMQGRRTLLVSGQQTIQGLN